MDSLTGRRKRSRPRRKRLPGAVWISTRRHPPSAQILPMFCHDGRQLVSGHFSFTTSPRPPTPEGPNTAPPSPPLQNPNPRVLANGGDRHDLDVGCKPPATRLCALDWKNGPLYGGRANVRGGGFLVGGMHTALRPAGRKGRWTAWPSHNRFGARLVSSTAPLALYSDAGAGSKTQCG